MIVTDGDLPEAIAALGLAGIYCSQPDVFTQFETWLRSKGYVKPEEKISRHLLGQGCMSLAGLLSEVEDELRDLRLE